MDASSRVWLVPRMDGRPHVGHRLDGRYTPMDPEELVAVVRSLVRTIDVSGVDYVVGFPEGGALPAFAFAQIVGRRVILSTRVHFRLSPAISFQEPHTHIGTTHYLHGLREGDRVVIVEDEVTTGRTLINAVNALRASGVHVTDVGVLLAVDTPAMWRRMADAGISLHVAIRVPADAVSGIVERDAP